MEERNLLEARNGLTRALGESGVTVMFLSKEL
jgi:hypothetical protein